MSSYSRVSKLEGALDELVGCFETSGDAYTIPVIDPVEGEIDGKVNEETTIALEEALNVLYGEECGDNDSYSGE